MSEEAPWTRFANSGAMSINGSRSSGAMSINGFEHVDRRFDRVERLVMWMLGVTLTGFTAVVAAVIGSMSGLR